MAAFIELLSISGEQAMPNPSETAFSQSVLARTASAVLAFGGLLMQIRLVADFLFAKKELGNV
jgi:hypothetical protein